MKEEDAGSLSDEELENVAGGGCHARDGRLVITKGYRCGCWKCRECGNRATGTVVTPTGSRKQVCYLCNIPCSCDTCGSMSYEGGLWLCNDFANRK